MLLSFVHLISYHRKFTLFNFHKRTMPRPRLTPSEIVEKSLKTIHDIESEYSIDDLKTLSNKHFSLLRKKQFDSPDFNDNSKKAFSLYRSYTRAKKNYEKAIQDLHVSTKSPPTISNLSRASSLPTISNISEANNLDRTNTTKKNTTPIPPHHTTSFITPPSTHTLTSTSRTINNSSTTVAASAVAASSISDPFEQLVQQIAISPVCDQISPQFVPNTQSSHYSKRTRLHHFNPLYYTLNNVTLNNPESIRGKLNYCHPCCDDYSDENSINNNDEDVSIVSEVVEDQDTNQFYDGMVFGF